MNQLVILLIAVLSIGFTGFTQTVNFVDFELKQYLISELCVDTTPNNNNGILFGNGYGDMDVDVNNDNEIQLYEAQNITNLSISDLPDNYSIKSIQDLNAFPNLEYLRIISNDSIIEISGLYLDSLKTLWIGSCSNLKIVDISNLSNLTKDLRIEDIDTLDYLNIQNGSVAQYFSMFYSDHIHSACVDSIQSEYNEIAWKMLLNPPSINNCGVLSTETSNFQNQIESFEIFPNPTNGIIETSSNQLIEKISVYNVKGEFVKSLAVLNDKIDVTSLNPGLYYLYFELGNAMTVKKLLKK